MPFDVGDEVVYPHHGAARVIRKETREAFGETAEYLVIEPIFGELTLNVRADNTAEVGLREVIGADEVDEVFDLLRKKEARMPTNWSRRFKNHEEKLKSGDVYQVSEVVRNLTIRENDKGLSAGEKRMLAKARQILISELSFALAIDQDQAELRLDEVLAQLPPDAGDSPEPGSDESDGSDAGVADDDGVLADAGRPTDVGALSPDHD